MAKATSVLAKLLRAKRAVPISSNENEPLGIERPCGYHAIQFRNTDAYNLCEYTQYQVRIQKNEARTKNVVNAKCNFSMRPNSPLKQKRVIF